MIFSSKNYGMPRKSRRMTERTITMRSKVHQPKTEFKYGVAGQSFSVVEMCCYPLYKHNIRHKEFLKTWRWYTSSQDEMDGHRVATLSYIYVSCHARDNGIPYRHIDIRVISPLFAFFPLVSEHIKLPITRNKGLLSWHPSSVGFPVDSKLRFDNHVPFVW